MPTIDTAQGPTEAETSSAVEDADVALSARLADAKDHPAVRGLGALSELADQPPLFGLCSAVLLYGLASGDRRAARAGAHMLASLLVATWTKGGVKKLVSRTRPNVLLEEGRYAVEPLGPDEGPWHSFPSGHTAGGLAVARAAARVYPEARGPAYAAAAAVALIQIPRGAHYLSDVAAGAAIGLAAEAAVDWLAGRLPPVAEDRGPGAPDGAGAWNEFGAPPVSPLATPSKERPHGRPERAARAGPAAPLQGAAGHELPGLLDGAGARRGG